MKVFSFGGGVQSTAALVLAAEGQIDYKTFLFANVGDDSENPDTLLYVEQISKPYAARHGLELIELRRILNGEPETLYNRVTGDYKTIPIPVRVGKVRPGIPGRRGCTDMFKIKVIAKWTREHGATPDEPATVGLGISLDEFQRMKDSRVDHQISEYPLITLRMTRADCKKVIADAGLPEPPKSSCWFCPYHRHGDWTTMRREKPELFEQAVEFERRINEKREEMGKDNVYLHSFLQPLDQAVGLQLSLFDDDQCDSGYCFV